MPLKTRPQVYIKQNIIPGASCSEILFLSCHLSDVHSVLPKFLELVDPQDNVAGLAQVHQTRHVMRYLAISFRTKVLVIDMSNQGSKGDRKAGFSALQSFLNDDVPSKSAFHMDKLATSLFQDHQLRINNAKDLFSLTTEGSRGSIEALTAILGRPASVNVKSVASLLDNPCGTESQKKCALEAWAACYGALKMKDRLASKASINTSILDQSTLNFVTTTIRVMSRVDALKPTRVKHDVDSEIGMKSRSNQLLFRAERYKTKFRNPGGPQHIEITTHGRDGKTHMQKGKLKKVDGRLATVAMSGTVNGRVKVVQTVGKEPPTSAEVLKTAIMLEALRDPTPLISHFFVKIMWFPEQPVCWDKKQNLSKPPNLYFPSDRTLNKSQKSAVRTILSLKDKDRLVVIHGPPGTGKTTVIAASVTSIMELGKTGSTIWLAAQSNVAVKNIAEKLAAVDFLDFTLIVSLDFHFDWHEHLYEKIQDRVLRTDNLPDDLRGVERLLRGSRVILCTVSMLSNGKIAPITTLVPVETVIFDEASQIDIADYLPALARFRPSIRKIVFIGDDKQLAPYGSNDVPILKSVFEHPHLRKKAALLDIQYRMPIPIGNFISKHVYNGLLKTQHEISHPSCCRFIDVSNGVEESKGHSWKNNGEVDVAIRIARQLNAEGKSFRIITPYDPQRSLLENGLKQAKLPWEDKCFNVDSFQGNEDDYIIVSVVRTKKLGFLNDKRRVNVMLTRCKKAMIICTNRSFIEGPGADSLVGGLCRSLQGTPWINYRKVIQPGFILRI